MSRLILGTASFGQPYGIKNDGVPSLPELEKIARVAWDGGIRVIHTSWQYGVDLIIATIFDKFELIRKDRDDPRYFRFEQLRGFSVYERNELWSLDPHEISYIQFPINILDNRFLKSCENAKDKSIKVIARSVFLQGLLLMDEFPKWLNHDTAEKIRNFKGMCGTLGFQPYEAALGWVLGLPEIDYIIVGVNSAEQLAQLLDVKPLQWDYDFSITDENVLDPRRWPTLENQLKKFVETSTAIEGVNIKL